MRKLFIIVIFCTLFALPTENVAAKGKACTASQWFGKRVVFLGDSITDPRQIEKHGQDVWWRILEERLGFEAVVYAHSGDTWREIMQQAERMHDELGDDFDAVIIFAGTNDYYGDIPLGEWYSADTVSVQVAGGHNAPRRHRNFICENTTLRGRINIAMSYLKAEYPTKQVIVLTPIHRAYAYFSKRNIQPDETYANGIGLFIDEYVAAIKETGGVWAVPVIDLNSVCGLYPLEKSHARYFRNAETDMLHPNTEGQRRMADALYYQLLGYPASFE